MKTLFLQNIKADCEIQENITLEIILKKLISRIEIELNYLRNTGCKKNLCFDEQKDINLFLNSRIDHMIKLKIKLKKSLNKIQTGEVGELNEKTVDAIFNSIAIPK